MYIPQGPSGAGLSPTPPNIGQQLYPFAFDPSYQSGTESGGATGTGAGAGPSSSSYEYSYSRTQPQSQSMMDTAHHDYQPQPQMAGGWYGEPSTSTSTLNDRGGAWPSTQTHTQAQSYDLPSVPSSHPPYANSLDLSSGFDNGRGMSNNHWPDEYVEPSSSERELVGLRMTLSDLVESIRPYAASPSNLRPPAPSAYLQSRLIRLASTIQTTLSNLQPHLHQTLHPQFNLPLPASTTSDGKSHGHGHKRSKSSRGSSAEKEMEVIRKRRDMLIARAAQVQVQASSHPTAVHNSQLPANWPANHGEIYQNGAGVYSNPNPNTNTNNAFFPSTDNPSLNSSRRSTITLENFDASLARFSLDPTKIGQVQIEEKRSVVEDGRCHGCGVSVTAEWRRGPDGPRSLCNACGLHYAKLTRRRAQEEADADPDGANGNSNMDLNPFPPSIHAYPVDGVV